MIHILIADDHPLVRKGMTAILNTVPDFEIVGQATTGQQAIDLAAALRPDVILMDLQMPDVTGIVATREITGTTADARILVVTLFEDDDSVFLALRAGARGYVLKDADEDEIIQAIRTVAGGGAIFSPAVAERVLAFLSGQRPTTHDPVFPDLTVREREILERIAQGYPNPRIAQQLGLSPKTVGNYVSIIFDKLQVADRAEAIIRARDAGMGRVN
ncbi:MAG: response regulator transcription factor [Chloroflexia bacterium]|jgi:DNA-binding NarL/FixJ family response regulator|nr:response regulator transcription factor [Chloroflexia bacterium]